MKIKGKIGYMKGNSDVTGVTPPEGGCGPTPERRRHAGKDNIRETGRSRSARRVYMLDDQLSKALARNYIDGEGYSALKRYATHWLAGGLQGHLASVDLDRVQASAHGLNPTERQEYHASVYYRAKAGLGERPAFVADHIACHDTPLLDVAAMLGFHSPYRGREKVKELLSDAAYRLGRFWKEMDR